MGLRRLLAVAAMSTALSAPVRAEAPVAPPAGWVPGQHARCMVIEVRAPDGRPIAGAQVSHYYVNPATVRGSVDIGSWTTDAAGRVCAARLLESGYLEIEAPETLGGVCAGYEELRHPGWRASAGKPPALAVTLHLKKLLRTRIVGRVVDADGRPVAGADVLAQYVIPKGVECTTANGPYAATDRSGRFRLPPIPHGRTTLLVRATDFVPQQFDVRVPAPARDFALDHGGDWTGRVLDPDGAVIEDCTVRLREKARPYGGFADGAPCSAAGFSLRHLPGGDVQVEVRIGRARATLAAGRVLLATVHLTADDHRTEDIVWPPGATIAGIVVTDDGTPVAGAPVMAVSTDRDRSAAGDSAGATTGPDGRFVFQHLAPGDWKLLADRDHQVPGSLAVVPAGTTDVRLVIPPAQAARYRAR